MSLFEATSRSIPEPAPSNAQCCCGNRDCAYLQDNNAALAALEKDVQLAARLGHALLVRHESYMADAEAERFRMSANIDKLETEKRDLLRRNAHYVEENRALADRLEEMNITVADSDAHIRSLTATLRNTERELQRLEKLSAKADRLEAELFDMETERAGLVDHVTTSKKDQRSAVQRWKQAERILADLQEQVIQMETEAKEERKQHDRMICRLEQGKTATGSVRDGLNTVRQSGDSIVCSPFEDILQTDADPHAGVQELRELLQRSNEEGEQLREQLVLHQPSNSSNYGTLAPQMLDQDLHPHLDLSVPLTPLDSPTRDDPVRRPSTPPSTAATLEARTVPTQHVKNSCLIQSNRKRSSTTASSAPSSPQSRHGAVTVFDRIDDFADSSGPTSPESVGPGSPWFGLPHIHTQLEASAIGFQKSAGTVNRPLASAALLASLQPPRGKSYGAGHDPTINPNSHALGSDFAQTGRNYSPVVIQELLSPPFGLDLRMIRDSDGASAGAHHLGKRARSRSLRRAASHESVISNTPKDIPASDFPADTPHSRPPRKSDFTTIKTPFNDKPQGLAYVNATTATAARQRRSKDSTSLLSSLATHARETQNQRAGGWSLRWGKWGVATKASVDDLRKRAAWFPAEEHRSRTNESTAASKSLPRRPSTLDSRKTAAANVPATLPRGVRPQSAHSEVAAHSAGMRAASPAKKMRPPGVNQDGPIWGLAFAPQTSSQVVVAGHDEEALRESLGAG